MTANSRRLAPRSHLALGWLWRRLLVAYALCPVVMTVIVAVGRDHRLAAGVLMVTTYLGTHVYAVVCGLSALGISPMSRVTGPLWDDSPLVGLLSLPVLIVLGRFANEPARTAGMAAVGVVLVAVLVRGYRNGFEPPEPNDERDER